jgi:hypothetical protein
VPFPPANAEYDGSSKGEQRFKNRFPEQKIDPSISSFTAFSIIRPKTILALQRPPAHLKHSPKLWSQPNDFRIELYDAIMARYNGNVPASASPNDSRVRLVLALETTLFVLAVLVYSARMYCRIRPTVKLGLDDLFITLAVVRTYFVLRTKLLIIVV